MQYLEWNDLIAKRFFNPEEAGKEVLLYVNQDIIEEIGRPYGCGQADFIAAVTAGPGWTTRSGFCQMALQTCENWRHRKLQYPPYIAYLACFVLAAGTQMDEVKENAYYPRLANLLGLPSNTRFASFNRVSALWDDLEKWSREDKHEELGRFVYDILGNMIWVGLPRFQTLISAKERKSLMTFFAEADLDPSDPPSEQVLSKKLIYHGSHLFQRRTKHLLNAISGESLVLKEKLLELIMSELEDWDGGVPEQKPGIDRVSYSIQTGLRLCMELDTIKNHASFTMRLKANRQFSGEELIFSSPRLTGLLICRDPGQGWSKVIRKKEGGRFDAAQLDWKEGIQLEDTDNKWKAKLKDSDVRLFVSGRNEGFSGWVENQRLERGIPVKIAACGAAIEDIRVWGEAHCGNFRELIVEGLPAGWKLFEGSNPKASCPAIDVLTLPSAVRLSFRGGIKVGGGNTYLRIAPPLVRLENGSGLEVPTVNGRALIRKGDEVHLWTFHEDTGVDVILRVEAEVEGRKLSKVLRLQEPGLANDYHAPKRDTAGNIIKEEDGDGTTFSGAVAHVEEAVPLSGTEFLRPSNRRGIYFVGCPGQICEWPLQQMPSWNPEWALEKTGRKEWIVTYCRKTLDGSVIASNDSDRQLVKKWKELVWFNRKKHRLPKIPLVRKRWIEFVEASKNV